MEARSTAGIYDSLLFYGSYYIFCSDTVSVFHVIDNFLKGDYDLLHDHVIALNVIFGAGDNFFNHKCGYSSMFVTTARGTTTLWSCALAS